jgi:hypothetical protein
MGWNDHVDCDLSELVGNLVDDGYLIEGTVSYGVAQQLIHQGEDSLSDKQRHVYKNSILPAMRAYADKEERQRIEELLARDD